jgi:hypothetical protein
VTAPKQTNLTADGRSSVATPSEEADPRGLPLHARTEFLRAIQRIAPAVLRDLRDEVMPKFRQILPWAEARLEDFATEPSRKGTSAVHYVWHSLEPPLFRWAARYNLSDVTANSIYNSTFISPKHSALQYDSVGMPFFTWLVVVATDTLAEWAMRDVEQPLDWSFSGLHRWRDRLRSSENSLHVTIPAWTPGTETREAFSVRARREFDNRLEEHVGRVWRDLSEPEPIDPGEPTEHLAPFFAEQIRQFRTLNRKPVSLVASRGTGSGRPTRRSSSICST